MAEIRTIRTARKPHDCQAQPCENTIQPGEQYLYAEMPPGDEYIGNTAWERMKVCQPCAERWGQSMAEQVTPRRARRSRRGQIARQADALDTAPSRRHVDEPRLHRPIQTIHAPALSA
ncbi:hypothetical protein [Micromonospora sp. LHW51205]|uniref:hypothetical protein n=1 Tax=Micromonospora sp. LHW51205 TaxID=2248752 RepID=UPI001F1FEBA8|nr:hypothetical protein [Micromonospora sp. LHW51205]